MITPSIYYFFFFNATATTEIYTLSLHDALPIFLALLDLAYAARCHDEHLLCRIVDYVCTNPQTAKRSPHHVEVRSEEHTSELQSQSNLVCRLLLEKKKKKKHKITHSYNNNMIYI